MYDRIMYVNSQIQINNIHNGKILIKYHLICFCESFYVSIVHRISLSDSIIWLLSHFLYEAAMTLKQKL